MIFSHSIIHIQYISNPSIRHVLEDGNRQWTLIAEMDLHYRIPCRVGIDIAHILP